MNTRSILAIAIAFFVTVTTSDYARAASTDGERIITEKCAECHLFQKPKESSRARLSERKGQDLYYSGSKYNESWLIKWLKEPTRIRPSGKFGHVSLKRNSGGDGMESASAHIAIGDEEAINVTEYMMTLKAPPSVVEPGLYQVGAYPPDSGKIMYTLTRGCKSCHMWAPGKGGRSGPELYTGGERMTADYIASYIKNPKAFDAALWMPRQGLSDSSVSKLTSFILGQSR